MLMNEQNRRSHPLMNQVAAGDRKWRRPNGWFGAWHCRQRFDQGRRERGWRPPAAIRLASWRVP
jgi:hypothetical protein